MKRTTPQPKEAQNTEPNVAHDISSVSEKIRRKRKQSGVRRARKKKKGGSHTPDEENYSSTKRSAEPRMKCSARRIVRTGEKKRERKQSGEPGKKLERGNHMNREETGRNK